MPTYVLSHEAEIDIAGITEYFAERNVTAAIKMLERIQEACQMLAENPEVGDLRSGFGTPIVGHLPSVATSCFFALSAME